MGGFRRNDDITNNLTVELVLKGGLTLEKKINIEVIYAEMDFK